MSDTSSRRREFLTPSGTTALAGLAGCLSSLTAGNGEERPPGRIALEPVVSGQEKPLGFEVAPGDCETFYVAEQTGRIRTVRDGTVAETFLDVRDRLAEAASEMGLLGFEFSVDDAGVDHESERVLLRLPQPRYYHNAGSVGFGPDGYLYVGFGEDHDGALYACLFDGSVARLVESSGADRDR